MSALTARINVDTMYIPMTTKVQKWGNSLAVRLPKRLARGLSLREGSDVEFSPRAGALVIRPSRKSRTTLKELLSKVRPGQVPKEFAWGRPFGKELW